MCNLITYTLPSSSLPQPPSADAEDAEPLSTASAFAEKRDEQSLKEWMHDALAFIFAFNLEALAPMILTVRNGEGKDGKFEWVERLELDDVLEVSTDASIEDILRRGHGWRLSGAGEGEVMWRVLVNLHPGTENEEVKIDVAIFWNHAIGDGFSGLAFQDAFLDYINLMKSHAPIMYKYKHQCVEYTTTDSDSAKVEKTRCIIDLPTDKNQTLRPNVEEGVQLSITASGMWGLVKGMLFPVKGAWTGPPHTAPPAGEVVATDVRLITMSAEKVGNLAKMCKEHGTSVTAWLTYTIANVMAGMKEELEAYGNGAGKKMEVDKLVGMIDISLRPLASCLPRVSPPVMATYTSAYTHTFPLGTSTFPSSSGSSEGKGKEEVNWEVVKSIKTGLTQRLSTNKNHVTAFLKLLSDVKGFLTGKVGKPREESFEVSNLGVVELIPRPPSMKAEEEWKTAVEEGREVDKPKASSLVFSQSVSVTGAPLVFSVVSLKGGGMSIVLCWQTGLGLETLAGMVAERVKARFGEL